MNPDPPAVDIQVGMGVYVTESPPCTAKIRVREEDFRLSELVNLEGLSSVDGQGRLPVYRVEKKGIDTFHAARIIAKRVRSRVSFGGVKDKRAAATQYVTPTSTRCERPKLIEDPHFRAELVGYLPRPLTRRSIRGNSFTIKLRDPCESLDSSVREAYRVSEERRLPNFYGLQRFGTRDPITHQVGRALVHGKFEEAVEVFISSPRRGEEGRVREAREMAATGRYKEAREGFTRNQDLETILLAKLTQKPEDYLSALRALPIAIRRFFVSAYQSYLFNLTLTRTILELIDISYAVPGDNWSELRQDGLSLGEVHGVREEPRRGALPLIQLVGYSYREYGSRFDRILMQVLKEEEVNPKEFYVKEAQEVSAEGGFRRASLTTKDLSHEVDGEGMILSFSLAKGEYATTLLREIMKPDDPFSAGF